MIALVLLAVVGAAPLTVASTGFEGPGLERAQRDRTALHFAQKLAAGGGVEVYARSANGLVRCGESGACKRAASDTVNASVTCSGTVTRLGSRFSVAVKLLDAVSGKALFASAFDAPDEKAVLAGLDAAAKHARGELGMGPKVADAPLAPAELPVATAPVAGSVLDVAAPAHEADWRPFTVLGAGLVSFGVSTFFFLQATDAQAALDRIERNASLPGNTALLDEARAQASRGRTSVTLGWTFAGVGAAAVAGGVAWLLFADRQDLSAALVPTPGGAAAVVAGTLP